MWQDSRSTRTPRGIILDTQSKRLRINSRFIAYLRRSSGYLLIWRPDWLVLTRGWTQMSDSACMCTCQVMYVDRKCYAKGIIEALCTCWPQPAAPVNSGNLWRASFHLSLWKSHLGSDMETRTNFSQLSVLKNLKKCGVHDKLHNCLWDRRSDWTHQAF